MLSLKALSNHIISQTVTTQFGPVQGSLTELSISFQKACIPVYFQINIYKWVGVN